jgi:histidine ammonia-lyase
METFAWGAETLTVRKALDLAAGRSRGVLLPEVVEKIEASFNHVQEIVENNDVVYGITTGFGPLCNTFIAPDKTKQLQRNILVSHSAGVGEPISLTTARLMLVLKAHALCLGYSGVALTTIERILWLLNHRWTPHVPKQGSVGASGDLAPLAHLFLPLIGLGKVWKEDRFVPAGEVLLSEGLEPLELGPKEGLALINGTQFIAAHAIQCVERLHNNLMTADIVGALSLESMMGSVRPFDPRLHNLRPHPGARYVAQRLRAYLDGSEILNSHHDCDRVQDPYSLRCIPQVHGTSWDAWKHLRDATEVEINSVTDNPVLFSAKDTISGGNFHGQPLALPLDYAAMAAAEIGNISDRRIYLMLEGKEGLPVLLMKETGINSGFMLAQYTSAALVSENKSLCFPVSVDSIPTSMGQEDHVSMGSISGRKALAVIDNLEKILAIEMLCAAQAFDFRRPLSSSAVLETCHSAIRQRITHAEEDRVFADDLEVARQIVATGILRRTATKAVNESGYPQEGELDERFRIS